MDQLPENPQPDETIDMGFAEFTFTSTGEFNVDTMRVFFQGQIEFAQQALKAFDEQKDELEKTYILANYHRALDVMVHGNMPLIAEWIITAMGRAAAEEAEGILNDG